MAPFYVDCHSILTNNTMKNFILHTTIFFSLISFSCSLQLCTDSRAPSKLNKPLDFCSYNESSCCSVEDDSEIEKQFKSMNVSDPACASLLHSILCAKCDPYSAQLFTAKPKPRPVPILCNSTANNFCQNVWDTCKDTPINSSPFAPSLTPTPKETKSSSKLTDIWKSDSDFCNSFGGSTDNGSICFSGNSTSFNNTQEIQPKGVCLERISNGSYLAMSPHPDGSNRVFLANQAGKIWLAKLPEDGGTLNLDEASTFLDISDEVLYDTEFGLMDIAFHPDFVNNGRFFVSYNCDKAKSLTCSGRCACNSDAGCDPSKLGTSNGVQPCQYQSVIAEFTVNSSGLRPSDTVSAIPYEVRRIFTMGLPYTSGHGGQILFGPEDGYMYFMMGDGGNKGDPFNFAQNKRSMMGKILRLDVDRMPSQKIIDDLGLWGNYSIPKDNPIADDSAFQEEIWALGLRNPWRCSFDSEKPSYFYCGDTGQNAYEEVDLITKGGNYGWHIYEGPDLFNASSASGGNTSASTVNAIFPILGYSHSALNNSVGSASVTGGYVYRSDTDPCMYGRYLYGDLYGGAMWVGTENPEGSGNYSNSIIPFSCSTKSPIPCDKTEGSSMPSIGYVFSYGEDNNKDVYVLTSKGVYKVVQPGRCNYTCPKKIVRDNGNTPPAISSAKYDKIHGMIRDLFVAVILLLAVF